jgi:hypothetical protein
MRNLKNSILSNKKRYTTMKHTGSVLVVLLVGLLISCTSTPSIATHVCTTIEQYLDLVQPPNPRAQFTVLNPRPLAAFTYNYNKEPPVSDLAITGVVVGVVPSKSEVLVAIAVDGCIAFQAGVSVEFLSKMLEEPREVELPISLRYKLTNTPTNRFNVII